MARPTLKLLTGIGCVCLASLSLDGPAPRAQQPEPPKDTPARQEEARRTAWLHDVFLHEATECRFYLDAAKSRKLELLREPVMRLTAQGDMHGEVYVWTHQGAAAVVGCAFSGPERAGGRNILIELHSLSPGPLVASGGGGRGWQPEEAGLDLMPVPDAPIPARTESLRLTQMRNIARRFSANITEKENNWELRLLPQPLYRYKPTDKTSPVVDGAVFAYVWTTSTDPEVLLVVEAHRTDSGLAWRYAPARFTSRECWVNHQGREVWRGHRNAVGIFDGVTNKRYGAFFVKTVPVPAEAK